MPDAPATILVVDDSATMREIVVRSLGLKGWRVEQATNADEGLALAREHRPDVVLVDFVLPDADGLVLLAEMRRLGVDAAAIALTGASTSEIAYRFLRAGVVDVLSKEGITGNVILTAVRRALLLRRAPLVTGNAPPAARAPPTRLDDPPEPVEAPPRPLRVLVIDDTAVARASVRAVLGREGWTIEEASDLHGALERLAGTAPDVVLLDYLLPDVDGIEALARMRDAGLRAPVIALTAHGSEDLAARFLRAGASDFLPKEDLSELRLVHAVRRAVALFGPGARP